MAGIERRDSLRFGSIKNLLRVLQMKQTLNICTQSRLCTSLLKVTFVKDRNRAKIAKRTLESIKCQRSTYGAAEGRF